MSSRRVTWVEGRSAREVVFDRPSAVAKFFLQKFSFEKEELPKTPESHMQEMLDTSWRYTRVGSTRRSTRT